MKENQRFNTRYLAVTGVLSAVAFVLQFIEIPIPMLIPSFVKFDFSDLPALLGAFAMGPLCGVLVELIKNLLHLTISTTSGVGELCNFLLGAVFTGTAGAVYKRHKTKKTAFTGAIIGAAAMAVFSLPFNLFITYPFYYNFMPEEVIISMYQVILPSVKTISQCLLIFNLPFTFVKGMVDVGVAFLLYPRIRPLLKGKA